MITDVTHLRVYLRIPVLGDCNLGAMTVDDTQVVLTSVGTGASTVHTRLIRDGETVLVKVSQEFDPVREFGWSRRDETTWIYRDPYSWDRLVTQLQGADQR